MSHRSIYFKNSTADTINTFIEDGIVSNYSQAVELAVSIASWFNNEALKEELGRLVISKPGRKSQKENKTNEEN